MTLFLGPCWYTSASMLRSIFSDFFLKKNGFERTSESDSMQPKIFWNYEREAKPNKEALSCRTAAQALAMSPQKLFFSHD